MTHVMTEKATEAWLGVYFFGKRYGSGADFTEIYTSAYTTIYEWTLDENVEVIETLSGYDADVGDYFYVYTVNFYEDKFSGTPYRTGSMRMYGI